ncbi:LysM peptidoglycan-binding domain-containing protein [Mycoplana dimorpha]|uniref:LysM domain-containing protein n=1 Tax=Mycoplana dimorpha TaxID=28320 RepID=A0A2T5BIP4_MYCDI|nr:LysM peptidoglycan-binding domain-containing protein [Mycoplana dimorpha]PTM98773.1 LysM domain-containing protein [Mycoplana dimorpha]
MTYKTGLVALGVMAAATALMVFFVLPNIEEDKSSGTKEATTQAAQPSGGPKPTDGASVTSEPNKPTAAAAPETGGQAASQAAGTDPATGWQTPSFDLLRVEPDGSTVIAGHAEPNKTLQILNGETIVATADVGPSGDFAAVFDKPLASGDHELTLRIVGQDGAAKSSEEVATVSIPKDSAGELLAMVTKPGAASRLITVLGPSGEKLAVQPKTTRSQAAQPQVGAAETAAVSQPDAGAAEQPPQETAGDAASAGTPSDKVGVRIAAVELEGDKMFVAGSAKPGALVRIYANDKLLGEIKTGPEGHYVVDGHMPLPVGRHTIRADVMSADGAKVELRASVPFDRPEGEQVAVVAQDDGANAGTAPSLGLIDDGTFDKLRAEANKAVSLLSGLYANGRQPSAEELAAARSATEIALQSLAQYRAPPGGAGEVIASRTAEVAAETLAKLKALPTDAATVGKSIGAIEAAVKDALTPATNGAAPAIAVATAPAVDIGQLETLALDLNRQFIGHFAPGAVAKPGEIQATRSALLAVLEKIAAYAAPTGTDASRLDLVDQLKVWAKSAADALSSVPADAPPESYAAALATLKGAPAPTLAGSDPGSEVANNAPATAAPAVGGTAADAGGATAAQQPGQTQTEAAVGQPQTVEQAPLQQSKTSVIIRRGDTLWQIARRVYGQGVRYTSIYAANQEQIADPDRILPGQIFGVPDEAMPEAEAEEMHRKRLQAR